VVSGAGGEVWADFFDDLATAFKDSTVAVAARLRTST
jgi:hypothetical protein